MAIFESISEQTNILANLKNDFKTYAHMHRCLYH